MFPGIEMINEAVSVVAGLLAVMAGGSLLTVAVTVALYIFLALGLYTIAMRRGINNPWLAWLPVANLWILGSIADQYRYVVMGQVRNRRKVMIGLSIAVFVMGLVLVVAWFGAIIKMLLQLPNYTEMAPEQLLSASVGSFILVVVIAVVMWVLNVLVKVFQYICLYDLYASCNPNKVLFLVLSIVFPVTMPVFVFVCRNQDGGMPPRKEDAQPVYIAEPVVTVEE